MKNGWTTISGYDVFVEDGKVMRGYGCNVYRACKDGGWDLDNGITVAAFRAGVARGTIRMM